MTKQTRNPTTQDEQRNPSEVRREFESRLTEKEVGNRNLRGWLSVVARWTAISYALFHLYTGGFGAFPGYVQRAVHVGFALVLAYLLYAATHRSKGKGRIPWYDGIAIILAIVMVIHISLNYTRYLVLIGSPATSMDLAVALSVLVILLEAARRAIGPVFSIMTVVFLLYALLGPVLPAPLTHAGFKYTQLLEALFLSTHGLWGIITRVMSTEIAVYMIFGSFLIVTGGGKAFMDLSMLLSGRTVGGPAKVAVIASSLFGTISGAATANVAVTGTFTIPMMKRLHYSPSFAAAVEAAASTGGQIMPPVMGAGAFVMAELLGMPYVEVASAAAMPAILFYVCLFAAVHFAALRQNLLAVPTSEMPSTRSVLRFSLLVPFFLPVAVLLYMLFSGYTAMYAGFWAIISCAVLFVLSDFNIKSIYGRLKRLVDALEVGGYSLVVVVVLSAAASVIVGVINYTGLGVRLSTMIVSLSSGHLLVGLLLSMLVTIILGMGLPTVAAYLLAAAIVAPALTALGVAPIAAHLFIFYYAILAVITPPVCIGVYIAAGIAGASWVQTAWHACRLALAGFIIPFMFVYAHELLLIGAPTQVIPVVITSLIGVVALAAGTMGYLRIKNLLLESILLIVGALAMIIPGQVSDVFGLGCVIVVWVLQVIRQRRQVLVAAGGRVSEARSN